MKVLENNITDFFPNGRTVDCFMKWKYGSLRASISKSKQMETTNSFTLLITSSFNNSVFITLNDCNENKKKVQ